MHPQTVIKPAEQGFHVYGDLVFATVLALIDKAKEHLDQPNSNTVSETIEINLASVKRIDSAGVALLIAWKRDCLASGRTCYFQSIPKQAISLLKTYKLLDIVKAKP